MANQIKGVDDVSVNPDSSNTTQAIWVGIGQLSSFLLAIISAAILSRYFDKAEYGTYRQILYIYNTLLVLFSAGLHGAYPYFLPKQSMEEGKDFVHKLLYVFLLLGFIFSITLYLLAPLISEIFNNQELKTGLRWFAVVPLLMLPTTGLEGIYSTIRKTHIIAIYTTLTRLFMLILITLPVIILKGSYLMAISGWVLASFLSCLMAIYLILKPFKNYVRSETPFSYKIIFSFSIPLMVATFYGILIRLADQFFISRYYGTEVFAEFSNGFIDLPFVAMVVGSTITVLIPLFSKYSDSESGKPIICDTWKRSIEKSVLIVYPLLLFFMFNSVDTVSLLYGEKYIVSGKYFVIGMLINFFNIIVYNPVLFSFGKTRLYSRIHLFQAILIWTCGFIIIYFSGHPLLYALVSRIFYIAQICTGIYLATRILKVRPREVIPFAFLFKVLIHCAIICGTTNWAVGLLEFDVLWEFIISGIISAALILFTGKFIDLPYFQLLHAMLLNIKNR